MQANGSTSVATMLEQMYTAILYPFEDLYKKNIQEQQRKAQLASRQMPMGQAGQMRPLVSNVVPQVPGQMQRPPMPAMGMMGQQMPNSNNPHFPNTATHTPQTPHQRPGSTALGAQIPTHNIPISQSAPQPGISPAGESNLLDGDIQGIKRKLDMEDAEGKRARQKTGMLHPPNTSSLRLPLRLDPLENNTVSYSCLLFEPDLSFFQSSVQQTVRPRSLRFKIPGL